MVNVMIKIKVQLISVFIVFFLSSTAFAGMFDKMFGPKTYEDCILKNMQGVTEKSAATAIKNACRSKFPRPESKDDQKSLFEDLTSKDISCLEGKAQLIPAGFDPFVHRPISQIYDEPVIYIEVYNKCGDVTVTSIVIEIEDEETEVKRKYTTSFGYGILNGNESGTSVVKLYSAPPTDKWNWQITDIEGYRIRR